ncbi:hypothetical protein GOBAR_AA17807 [Gossypium barbadense]|uniref:Uncharacterized protein n=1 Tax=Gossypium barbadense TaxID=3634 RepID=A0A2P5XHN3_GOSBA|nr:hypothetical protein GOBAR_AA17807 [Gossypium barbadense]
MEGRRPLVSPPVKNWGLIITSQYAFPFLARLSSFMVRYSGVLGVEEQHQSIPNLVVKLYCVDDTVGEGTPGNRSSGDEVGPVAQRIRARGYEPRCRGFESLLAHNRPKREGPFPLGPRDYGTKDYPGHLHRGFEPTTSQLTADRSTAELLRNNGRLDLIEFNSRSQPMTNMNSKFPS